MKIAVWHRRDLRVQDNRALAQAAEDGDVIVPVFVLEPRFYQKGRYHPTRYQFLLESLLSLRESYRQLGTELVVLQGDPLQEIQKLGVDRVYFNHDTNGKYGMSRDLAAEKLGYVGFDNDGIQRQGRRNDWNIHVKKYFHATQHFVTKLRRHNFDSTVSLTEFFNTVPRQETEPGGEKAAMSQLGYFSKNLANYTKSISSPLLAETGTSRLSAHFSFGTISTRQVYQHIDRLAAKQKRFYQTRLFWNQHFTQKLADNPDLDRISANPIFAQNYDKLYRPSENLKKAWQEGKTGYPLVDASMRALVKTGFLNFRMRAMVASFYTYILQQPWQDGADFMFANLTDADRAINYAQWQMQTGQVGVHPNRIYNPTKQILDHDPECRFIKKYVPELSDVEPALIIQDPESRGQMLFGEFYIQPATSFQENSRWARETYYPLNKQALALVRSDAGLRQKLSLSGVAGKRTNQNKPAESKVV